MGGALRGLALAVLAALLGGATGLWLAGSDLFRDDDRSDEIFAATAPDRGRGRPGAARGA